MTAERIEDVLGEMPDVQEGFVLDSLEKANWAMGKIVAAEKGMSERTALANTYAARITAWLTEANKSDLGTANHMRGLLAPWVAKTLEGGKARSVKLLGGVAGYRTSPDTLEVVDETLALAILQSEYPRFVRVKESVDKVALKAHMKATGECFEGIELKAGETAFYVKVE